MVLAASHRGPAAGSKTTVQLVPRPGAIGGNSRRGDEVDAGCPDHHAGGPGIYSWSGPATPWVKAFPSSILASCAAVGGAGIGPGRNAPGEGTRKPSSMKASGLRHA
jgi:hypothetical protein